MPSTRIAASVIAAAVFVTLALRLSLTADENATTFLGAAWHDYRYFTIWTNTLVGGVCAILAFGRVPPQWLTAGPALAIALVAGVYHALLAEGRNLVGLELAVDIMVHTAIPAAFIGLWLVALPKGQLAWRDLIIWSAYPILYSVYAIVRGAIDGTYPYFFLDVATIGATGVAAWVAGLALVFLFTGAIIIGLARQFARPSIA